MTKSLRFFLFLIILLAISCGGGSNNTATPPTIFSVGPSDLSINVSPTSFVSCTFSEEMNHTATEGAFSLSTAGVPVAGSFSWSGYTMKFTPDSPLTNSASYTLSISTDAMNSSGTHLANAHSSSITIGEPAIELPNILNTIEKLATSDLSGWTENLIPPALRNGRQIESLGGSLYYTQNTDNLNDEKAFQVEAVIYASSLAADGVRGAALWVKFRDSDLPDDMFYYIIIRLEKVAGIERVALVDGNSFTLPTLVSLNIDWSNSPDPIRVRIKRQNVEGTDYILLQTEHSASWDDPDDPNNPDSQNSKAVQLKTGSFIPDIVGPGQIGFGNAMVGTYSSYWTSIHISIGPDLDTVFPYWPPVPPTPILIFDDKGVGNLQGVSFSSYDSHEGYLINDTITSYLDADGTTYTGTTETNPLDEYWNFNGLGADQDVTGYVTVEDVSGRSRTSGSGNISIPVR